jgi:hypothetical protein
MPALIFSIAVIELLLVGGSGVMSRCIAMPLAGRRIAMTVMGAGQVILHFPVERSPDYSCQARRWTNDSQIELAASPPTCDLSGRYRSG